MQGNCLTSSVVYQATVTAPQKPVRTYVGLTKRTFKDRFNSHKYDMRHEKGEGTCLSKYVWDDFKHAGFSHEIKWKTLDKCSSYQPGSGTCHLCLTEKFRILNSDPSTSLNKRSELVSKCRHSDLFKLEAVT